MCCVIITYTYAGVFTNQWELVPEPLLWVAFFMYKVRPTET